MGNVLPLTQKIKTETGNQQLMSDSKETKTASSSSYSTNTSFLREIREGNESAWFEFHRKYSGMIRYIGQKRQLTPEECDDLLINVMTIFWKRIDNFIYEPERGKFRSYLGKITDNAAVKILRKKHQIEAVPIDHTAALEYPDEIDGDFMDEWRDFVLKEALEELKNSVDTENYQIFYMSFFQKRSVKDISELTGKSTSNIYTIRSRVQKKLKELIALYRQRSEEFSSGNSQRNIQEN